jgi:hypothetical protein
MRRNPFAAWNPFVRLESTGREARRLESLPRLRRILRVGAVALCTTIVAVFQVHLDAASPLFEDVSVPGGPSELAHALGIDPVPDRGRFLFELTRLVYDSELRSPPVAAFLQEVRLRVRAPAAGARGLMASADGAREGRRVIGTAGQMSLELVSVPLKADVWSSAVFHRKVARDDLVLTIIADRQASLLCHGLTALDDDTLQFFADHPSLLTRLIERAAAPAFAAFSGSLRVQGTRVVPPGGDAAAPLWEAVVGEKVTRAERFVSQLFELNEGRVAYLYDTIGQLDPPRRAFALGSWMTSAAARLDRFRALASVGANAVREWHIRTLPFGRASYDLAMTLARIEVDDNGAPLPPSSRGFWSRVLGSRELPDETDQIDAAWLTEAVGSADVRIRAERLDQIAFGQRLFGESSAPGHPDRPDVLFALRGLPRYRMLMLTLERIGLRKPATYAAAVRQAARVTAPEGRRGFTAQAQFQGALALVARAVGVQTLDVARAEMLLERLIGIPIAEDGRFGGAIARWVRDDFLAAVPAADTAESTIIGALSGVRSGDPAAPVRVTWEGQQYRLDLGAAERQRLHRVRDKQNALPIDVALEIASAGRKLGADGTSLADAPAITARLTALAGDLPNRSRDEEADHWAGAGMSPEQHDVLRKALDELTRAVKNRDAKRVPRAAEPLIDLADEMLAYSLLSFAYAVEVGDPDGAVLLAGDVSHRHDFGFALKDADLRLRTAWAIPRQEVVPSVPWHVTGSLLGLDIALAPLALRRMSADGVLEAPKLTANEREAFALSVSLMNPFALRDADRDAIADAIEMGRRRVRTVDERTIESLADDLAMPAWRRRAVRWTLAHEPDRLLTMLSLAELLVVGGGHPADLSPWGMAMLTASGCICTRLTPPTRWATVAGRPQLGLIASIVPDLNLHVAMVLKELQLPAALTRVVVSAAMQDFIDEVRPTDDADWLTLVRGARAVSRERIEDYVAAATATGPLVPDTTSEPPRER